MQIFDLSKELYTASVYPGDPVPAQVQVMEIAGDCPCRVTKLSLGSHSGTHMDAPCHFVKGAGGIDSIALTRVVGQCQVKSHNGLLTLADARALLADGVQRLLLKGDVQITQEAALYMAKQGLLFLGIEPMSVGDALVHRALLAANIAVLEAAVIQHVPLGAYLLCAAPILLGGLDGAPVRPILMELTGN